jgi:hypothetical protein
MMKIVQKIETGGTSRTSTPILKFLINELLLPSEARHITHCAGAEFAANNKRPNPAAVITRRHTGFRIQLSINDSPQPVPAARRNEAL